jgi:hypothetical protein
MDLSFGRLEYHYRLSSKLVPMKAKVQRDVYTYHGDVPQELQDCKAYDRELGTFVVNCSLSACEQNAILLSELRQEILQTVRNSYPFSRLAAEFFDEARGIDQKDKISGLFGRKSCEQVVLSSDRTNRFVDIAALMLGLCSLIILWKGTFGFINLIVFRDV